VSHITDRRIQAFLTKQCSHLKDVNGGMGGEGNRAAALENIGRALRSSWDFQNEREDSDFAMST
jgi:hypothetical protein